MGGSIERINEPSSHAAVLNGLRGDSWNIIKSAEELACHEPVDGFIGRASRLGAKRTGGARSLWQLRESRIVADVHDVERGDTA